MAIASSKRPAFWAVCPAARSCCTLLDGLSGLDGILDALLEGNFNGGFPGGGSGSTQMTVGGIGTNGTSAQFPGGTLQSVMVGATGDGGSASDYRLESWRSAGFAANYSPVPGKKHGRTLSDD